MTCSPATARRTPKQRRERVFRTWRLLAVQSLEARCLLTTIPGIALFADPELTITGLVGSYVDQSLEQYSLHNDWRQSQTISGTRVDPVLDFVTGSWGDPELVGITHGTAADWDDFSVQWDGYLAVSQAGQRLATVSDDGSRMWIDLNGDQVIADNELVGNGWGQGQAATTGERTAGLSEGTYAIRDQYYELTGENTVT